MFATAKILVVMLALVGSFADDTRPPGDLLAAGRVDDAIASLQSRISNAPNDAASYNLLCRAYFSLADWNRGIAACQKAVSLDPSNSRYHLWLGRLYGEKADSSNFLTAAGLAKNVRNEFETAVRLSPDNTEARTDLAEFYLEAPGIVGGGQDRAEEQARTLVTLDPARAHWVRGRIAEKKKEPVTAEKEYRAAIEASHGSSLTWFNLALFYRHGQRWDEMEEALNHAVAAPPDRPEILMETAEILLRAERNLSGAVQLLHRYLSNSTVEPAPAFKAHYLLGTALEKQGNKQGAAQEYHAALALAKNFSRAQEALNRLNR
jgi:tetratricopeptide (TPR) repeat protein